MNAPIDALAFAAKFESAGFDHDQARALAAAFAEAGETIRSDLVTKDYLDLRLAELETRLGGQMGDLKVDLQGQMGDLKLDLQSQMRDLKLDLQRHMSELKLDLNRQMGEMELRLTRQIAEIGKDVSNRLWSTVAIIAGVSTAISATVGAGVALLLKLGGL